MAEPFITEAELAAFLSPRAPADMTDDLLATMAVEAASDLIRAHTEQELAPSAEDSALFVGDGERRDLLLPQCPVSSVIGVALDAEATLEWLLTSAGILRLPEPLGAGVVAEVEYVHGYSLDAGDVDRLPADLRMLAATLGARSYQQGISRQESTGSSSVTYATASNLDLTGGERALLAKYRRPSSENVAALVEASP